MTFEEFYDMAGVVVRLRKDLEAAERLATDRQRERDQARDELGPVALQLSAHVESLKLSNAQCGEYLRRNEQLHSELVEVRAALASVTEQRDSLQRTLDEWERADTKPHERIYHQPLPDELEFRAVVPTPEMLAVCSWWEVQGSADVICFKNKHQRPVVWRSLHGDASWQYDDCPQPLKPSKRTWKQLDLLLATAPHDVADHVVPPVLPICTTCHGCGSVLYPSPAGDYFGCGDVRCTRSNTKHWHPGCTIGPYAGPCKSTTPVRHE